MQFVEMNDGDVGYKESEKVTFEEPGREFVGKYIGFFEFEGSYGPGVGHKFVDVDDDELEYVIFQDSVLKSKMTRVPLDAIVKIVYIGKKKSEKTGVKPRDAAMEIAVERVRKAMAK